MEEPGGLQSMGSQRGGHDWVTNTLWGAFVSFTCLLHLSCTLFFFVCLGKCQYLTNNPTLASLQPGLLRAFDSSSEPGLHWNHGGSVNTLTPGSLPRDSDFIDLDRHWSAAWEWRFLKASQKSLLLFLKFIYLAALGLSCNMWILSCDTWDLVPWPGIEPGHPLHWESRVLTSGPWGKSPGDSYAQQRPRATVWETQNHRNNANSFQPAPYLQTDKYLSCRRVTIASQVAQW